MEVKIVGTITDENQLDELQAIAKIFVYEQRMKTIIPPKNHQPPLQTISIPKPLLIHHQHHIPSTQLRHIRGFA